jgi:hypothetical protein
MAVIWWAWSALMEGTERVKKCLYILGKGEEDT